MVPVMNPELRARCIVRFGRPGTGVGWISNMARATLYSRETVSRWANGKTKMSERAIRDVERALENTDP